MDIADNILRSHLKNVYFISGTACGGKTTISRELAKKSGFALYDMDAHYMQNKELADSEHQPAMTRQFRSWDEYFNRPYLEYSKWLIQSLKEQIPMVLIDLIKLSQVQPVIADLHLSLDFAKRFTDNSRIVFLIAEPQLVSKDYYKRPDHKDLYDCIMSLENPQKAFQNCSKALEYVNQSAYAAIKSSDWFWIERNEYSTVENILKQVEDHFSLGQSVR